VSALSLGLSDGEVSSASAFARRCAAQIAASDTALRLSRVARIGRYECVIFGIDGSCWQYVYFPTAWYDAPK